MKKIVTLLFIAAVAFSCSTDEAINDTNIESNAELLISKYDNSNFGVYKGTFAALNTQGRGLVQIEINEQGQRASIVMEDNTEIKFVASTDLTLGADSGAIQFKSAAGSFDFLVGADGSSPKVFNVELNGNNGDVVLVKETSRAPVTTVTGTFGCFDCPEHPYFGNPDNADNLAWNIIFQGDGTGEDIITTQVMVGPRTETAVGFQNNPYLTLGDYTLCEVGGSTTFGAVGLVQWSGTHTYTTSRDCSSLIAVWNFQTATYDISGWITSDERCFEF